MATISDIKQAYKVIFQCQVVHQANTKTFINEQQYNIESNRCNVYKPISILRYNSWYIPSVV